MMCAKRNTREYKEHGGPGLYKDRMTKQIYCRQYLVSSAQYNTSIVTKCNTSIVTIAHRFRSSSQYISALPWSQRLQFGKIKSIQKIYELLQFFVKKYPFNPRMLKVQVEEEEEAALSLHENLKRTSLQGSLLIVITVEPYFEKTHFLADFIKN